MKDEKRESPNKMSERQARQLLDEAIKVAGNAYNPRSNFAVGAAVLTKKGNIYHGVNVESVISGLGTCAERNALDTMCTNGEYDPIAISCVCPGNNVFHPCGACLQYIFEFSTVAQHDIDIVYGAQDGTMEQSTARTLLPGGFGPTNYDLARFRRS